MLYTLAQKEPENDTKLESVCSNQIELAKFNQFVSQDDQRLSQNQSNPDVRKDSHGHNPDRDSPTCGMCTIFRTIFSLKPSNRITDETMFKQSGRSAQYRHNPDTTTAPTNSIPARKNIRRAFRKSVSTRQRKKMCIGCMGKKEDCHGILCLLPRDALEKVLSFLDPETCEIMNLLFISTGTAKKVAPTLSTLIWGSPIEHQTLIDNDSVETGSGGRIKWQERRRGSMMDSHNVNKRGKKAHISDATIRWLVSRNWFGPRTTSLKLHNCTHVNDSGLDILAAGFPWLEHLLMTNAYMVTDPGMVSLCKRLPNLKSLELHNAVMVGDEGFSQVYLLEQVESVSFPGCWQLSDSFLEVITRGLPDTSDKRHATNQIHKMDNNQERVHKHPQQIQRRGSEPSGNWISHTRSRLSNKSLYPKCAVTIRKLDLSDCISLTTNAITLICKMPNLDTLRLAGCKGAVTDASLKELVGDDRVRSSLICLDISRCAQLNINSTIKQLLQLRNLIELGISGLNRLSDAAIASICNGTRVSEERAKERERSMKRNSQRMRSASEDSSGSGNNKCGLTQLQVLNLSVCPLITDDGLCYIANSLKNLSHLYLGRNSLISTDGIAHLRRNLTQLKTIDLLDCVGVSPSILPLLEEDDKAEFHFNERNHQTLCPSDNKSFHNSEAESKHDAMNRKSRLSRDRAVSNEASPALTITTGSMGAFGLLQPVAMRRFEKRPKKQDKHVHEM